MHEATSSCLSHTYSNTRLSSRCLAIFRNRAIVSTKSLALVLIKVFDVEQQAKSIPAHVHDESRCTLCQFRFAVLELVVCVASTMSGRLHSRTCGRTSATNAHQDHELINLGPDLHATRKASTLRVVCLEKSPLGRV